MRQGELRPRVELIALGLPVLSPAPIEFPLTSTCRGNCRAGINARFTRIPAPPPKLFCIFRAVLARDPRADAPAELNAPIRKIRARGLMLPAESSTFTKVLTV
jgi:hypothetical protein